MRANLELKARCADLERARERAREVATAWLGVGEQTDTYFTTRAGRLELRAVSDGPGLARMLSAMLGVRDEDVVAESYETLLGN